MAAVPEKSLERYELIDRIAVGGMAEVFRAKAYGAHGFEKTLAIKRILPDLARDPEFEARFIREAKLAVQLTHANIVHILDFGRFAGSLFIAMEFIDGLDLAALLKIYGKRGERVPLAAAFQIAIDLTRGLDFAHSHSVVHRDVSPSNILLSKAGEVKIADFGIAMAAASTVDKPRPSARRRIMGKWRYMSPEQTRGDPLDSRSDLFSAASVIYELFTGEKLFKGQEADQIIESIHSMDIPRVSDKREGVPARLDEVLAGALERDPERRTSKASGMLRALTELSYESSLVATALDVAEAVASAFGKTAAPVTPSFAGGLGIDDLIREQLGGEGRATEDTRRTAVDTQAPGIERAVTELAEAAQAAASASAEAGVPGERQTHTATIVRKGMNRDGVTEWDVEDGDENTIAAVPSAIRIGKRTGSLGAITDDPPPRDVGDESSQAAQASATAATATSATSATADSMGQRRWWLLGGALAILTLGGVMWTVGRGGGGGPSSAAAVPPDARPQLADAHASQSRDATLSLDSEPRGATVRVDGKQLARVTPTTVKVLIGSEHDIVMELSGHRRWSDRVPVSERGTVRVKANLVRERATLVVKTTPVGATVTLAGKRLGVTPLTRRDLSPVVGAKLVIEKAGFRVVTLTVGLADAKTVTVDRSLRSIVRYGKINLFVRGSWAEVWFRGRKIAQGQRLEGLKLPLGRHTLKLINPASKRQTSLIVEVVADRVGLYKASL